MLALVTKKIPFGRVFQCFKGEQKRKYDEEDEVSMAMSKKRQAFGVYNDDDDGDDSDDDDSSSEEEVSSEEEPAR
jgi:hypothetical protein